MPISGARVLALQNRKHIRTGGFHKTVHFEKITRTPGATDYRSTAPVTTFSILITPAPVVRLLSEEDIAQAGQNVSMGDYMIEIPGDGITEQQLRDSTQILFNKGLPDEEMLQIQFVRPGKIVGDTDASLELFIVEGMVIIWNVHCRATKRAV